MPTRDRLTVAGVKGAKPREKAYKLADGAGMYLLVHPDGARYWRLKYRWAGKEKTLGLGVYPEVGLAKARKRRDEAREQLAAGVDPSAARKEERRARIRALETSFEAVAKQWTEQMHATQWGDGTYAAVLRTFNKDLFPDLGRRPVAEITAPELLDVLRKVERRGAYESLSRLRQRVEHMFTFAVASGLCQTNPAAGLQHALTKSSIQGYRAMPAPDLPEFLRAVEGYRGEAQTLLGLKLLVLTFVRTGELRVARWAEFCLEGDDPMWTVPGERMKNGLDHLVPLARQTVAILKQLRALNGHRDLLFPSTRNWTKPISENTLLYALYRLGYHGRATGHGFRKLASTLLNEMGWNRDAIERQLAHVPEGVRGIYNKAEYLDTRRRMMQAWADHLDAVREGAEVVPFARRTA